MTSVRPSVALDPARPDDGAAVRGARWVTAAWLAVGALNYGYALVLTRLLDVGAFSTFAAGQGLLLCAATVAAVAIPWVLAQAMARATSPEAAREAIRFAMVVAAAGGVVAGGIVAAVAAQFATAGPVAVLGVATFLVFLTRVSAGRLQGSERMRTLSCALTGEAAVKVLVGLLFVAVLGLGATGALAAFGVAAASLLIWWPVRAMRGGSGRWISPGTQHDLWRRALQLGTVQGLVAMMATLDLVVITLLPAGGPATASYQAGVMVGRAPLFVASALSVAFFPALSRQRGGTPLAASAVRMYLIVALPLTAVCATAPGAVLHVVFPPGYEAMGRLLMFTAVSGLAVGGINLVSTFFQAVNDQSCVPRQAIGVLVFLGAVLVGWRLGGVQGFALGGSVGAVAALLLLVHLLIRRQGSGAFAEPSLVEPLLVACVLVALRPVPVVWLVAAVATSALAAVRFLRHRAHPPAVRASARTAADGPAPGAGDDDAVGLLLDAVWHHAPRPAGDEELRRALAVARRSGTEGLLALAYPGQLAETAAEVRRRDAAFRDTVCRARQRLHDAGIDSVLIKADVPGPNLVGDADVVVPDGRWAAAERALSAWCGGPRDRYWLERRSKVFLRPPSGPEIHLHACVSWFGVPVLPNSALFAHAVPADGRPWPEPRPADRLRIWLAHALFQNLSLDLSELLAIRPLLDERVTEQARREAAREGWGHAYERALRTAREAVERLDRGERVPLPVRLTVPVSLGVAVEHTPHLLRQGRVGAAAREAALRIPLVVAKRRKKEDA